MHSSSTLDASSTIRITTMTLSPSDPMLCLAGTYVVRTTNGSASSALDNPSSLTWFAREYLVGDEYPPKRTTKRRVVGGEGRLSFGEEEEEGLGDPRRGEPGPKEEEEFELGKTCCSATGSRTIVTGVPSSPCSGAHRTTLIAPPLVPVLLLNPSPATWWSGVDWRANGTGSTLVRPLREPCEPPTWGDAARPFWSAKVG